MSSAAAQEEAAVRALADGNVDFAVRSVTRRMSGSRDFIILLPLTVVRMGIFGPLTSKVGLSWVATKFGRDLLDSLSAIEGVEPSIDKWSPTGMTVHVSSYLTDDAYIGCRHQIQGLPFAVAKAIQAAIMRNSTFTRRTLEYIRRAI